MNTILLSAIQPNCPPSVNELPPMTTKAELAQAVYPDIAHDTALPQPWVDECQQRGFDPRPCFVWGYPKGSVFGCPLPLTKEAAREIPSQMIWGAQARPLTITGFLYGNTPPTMAAFHLMATSISMPSTATATR